MIEEIERMLCEHGALCAKCYWRDIEAAKERGFRDGQESVLKLLADKGAVTLKEIR